ncbi:hypothetical protein MUTS6_35490 [Escherichia coli]|nr:hypothetical protein MUTS6_35490 [Escherichia coli]
MRNAHRIFGATFPGHGNRYCSRRPGANLHRRNAHTPATIGLHRSGVFHIINRDGKRRAFSQPRAAAGNHQRLPMLDDIDHIIARHRIDPQTGQIGVDGDIPRAAAGVAVLIGDRGAHR